MSIEIPVQARGGGPATSLTFCLLFLIFPSQFNVNRDAGVGKKLKKNLLVNFRSNVCHTARQTIRQLVGSSTPEND
jgi:hypothetical protein